jgi:hypothetical protein
MSWQLSSVVAAATRTGAPAMPLTFTGGQADTRAGLVAVMWREAPLSRTVTSVRPTRSVYTCAGGRESSW